MIAPYGAFLQDLGQHLNHAGVGLGGDHEERVSRGVVAYSSTRPNSVSDCSPEPLGPAEAPEGHE